MGARSDPEASADAAARRKPPRKRISRTMIRGLAWAAGIGSFTIPWAALQALPKPAVAAAPQVVVVPAGSKVTITKGAGSAVRVVTSKGTVSSSAPVTSTHGSVPPP
jgi:hypothetical protein